MAVGGDDDTLASSIPTLDGSSTQHDLHEIVAGRYQILRWLGSSFNVIPLGRGVEQLRGGTLPARAVSSTFDDGYADNFTVGLPILVRPGLSAPFFVASGFRAGGPSSRFAADSASVVRAGLKGLERGQAIVIPGLMNKSTAQAHRFFPRGWVRRIAGSIKL